MEIASIPARAILATSAPRFLQNPSSVGPLLLLVEEFLHRGPCIIQVGNACRGCPREILRLFEPPCEIVLRTVGCRYRFPLAPAFHGKSRIDPIRNRLVQMGGDE